MEARTLGGGFANPPIDAAGAFRGTMDAMARPGQTRKVTGAMPPEPLCVAAGSVLLALCDTDTPLYLAGEADCAAVRDWVSFHTGAPFAGPSHCMFALGTWEALMPLPAYPVGTAEYPDRSATLIVNGAVAGAQAATLTGPGIKDSASLDLPDIAALQANNAMFPLGLDFLFATGEEIVALPRSTTIHVTEAA